MQYLKKYARKHWKMFSLSILFVMLEALADLMQPTLMALIVDEGVARRDMAYVLRMGGLMLLITAAGAAAASARNILSSLVSQRFGMELRGDLYRKILSLSFANIDRFDKASLMTRLTNDVSQVQHFVNGMMRIFAKAPMLCIGSLIMAARLNPHLAVVLAVVVPVVALLITINMKIGFVRFRRVQEALDRVNSAVREYLSGVRVVKAFNRFDYEEEKFDRANTEYQLRSIRAIRTMALFSPAVVLTMNLGIVAVLWLGGLGAQDGRVQVGQTIAFVNYMTQILYALGMIFMIFTMFVRAKASALRIGEVFAETEAMTWLADDFDAEGTERGRIDFENVSFSYEGAMGTPVIRNISFTCMPGETVGIIGSTGSGKSTLVSLIPRFYDAVSGTVKVNGVDVRTIDPRKLREKIALVPQKNVLFTGTILENIRMGKADATLEEVIEAARMAQAHEFISAFPEGYETRLGQRGVNLSGGQKQRISIARALVRKPEILILDDCTSAVDVVTEAKIKSALKEFAKDLTCIIIAQRITSVMDADKIVVLDQGEIAGIGRHETLLRTCRVYREIYQSQMGKEIWSNV